MPSIAEPTSELRLEVSEPTRLCFSINTVLTPSLCCNLLAMARPTAPPPITACVKSAPLGALVEKCVKLFTDRVAVLVEQRADWRSAFAPPFENISLLRETVYGPRLILKSIGNKLLYQIDICRLSGLRMRNRSARRSTAWQISRSQRQAEDVDVLCQRQNYYMF